MLPSSPIFSEQGSSRGGFVWIWGCNRRSRSFVRSEVLEFVRHPAFPLNTRSAESMLEQNLQNALSKAANFVKDFGRGILLLVVLSALDAAFVGEIFSMEVWGWRLYSNDPVIPWSRAFTACLLWEMSLCAGWTLPHISSCFSLCFFAVCHLQWGIVLWDELFMHCWGSTFLVGCADLIAAAFPSHCCTGETLCDSCWQISTAQLCL